MEELGELQGKFGDAHVCIRVVDRWVIDSISYNVTMHRVELNGENVYERN